MAPSGRRVLPKVIKRIPEEQIFRKAPETPLPDDLSSGSGSTSRKTLSSGMFPEELLLPEVFFF